MDNSETPTKYFIRSRGKVMGPFTMERLKTLQARGQFSRVHEVSEDRKSWRPAASLDGLFETQLISRKQSSPVEDPYAATELTAGNATAVVPAANGQARWYYHLAGEQHGPVPLGELRSLVRSGRLQTGDLVWNDSLPDWMPLGEVDELAVDARAPNTGPSIPGAHQMFCFSCGATINNSAEICPKCGVRQAGLGGNRRNRTTAAMLALFLGWLGVHRFYLGQTMIGIAYPVYLFVLVPGIVFLAIIFGNPILATFLKWILPCIPVLISLVEVVVLLCMSDETFNNKYNRR